MQKQDELVSQLFILLRAQGALLSAVIKALVETKTIDKKDIKQNEKLIMSQLETISELAAKNQDVTDKLAFLEQFIFNEEQGHVA